MLGSTHKERQFSTSKNLCMAGGVALNAIANSAIKREELFANVYIQPSSSDVWLSIGSATMVDKLISGEFRGAQPDQDSLGREYRLGEILSACHDYTGYVYWEQKTAG